MAKLICIKGYNFRHANGIEGILTTHEIHNGHFSYEYDNWFLQDKKYPQLLFYPKDCFMLLSEYREKQIDEILND